LPDDQYARPDGATDAEVAAAGKLSEALECMEHARGYLYGFHRLVGRADFTFEEAADLLEKAGHADHAEHVRTEIVGRNVVNGRWTFQVVDEFEALYVEPARRAEAAVRDDLMAGRKHVFEAELKEQRRTRGRPGHESRPAPD
jgi:hypothetical protein